MIGHVEEDADASIIENCSFSGEVYGNHRVGGIIGLGTGTLKDCVNYAKVVCDYAGAFSGNVGGLSGDFHGYGSTGEGGYITNCANYGDVFCETGAAGGILGTTRDITMLRYCRNYGNVKGSYVGGITGQMGSFEYCQNSGNITSQSTDGLNAGAGGITSVIFNGYVKNCFNSGTITGVKGIGGIISHAIIGSTISCSKNVGRIQGTGNNVGGIAGEPKGIIIECCINEGSVEGDTYVGGIAGLAKSAIKHCSNNGLVKGFRNVGGIGGEGSLFEYCMNDGQISANNAVGGIVGNTKGDVLDCVNTGHIQSSYGYASGISGTGGKTIKNCYNTGRISGLTGIGGIIGKTDVDGFLVENCYNSGKIDPCSSSGGIVGYAMNNGGQVLNSYYLESSVDKAIGSYWMSITVDFKDSPVSTTDLKSMPELLLGSYMKLAVAIPILFWSKKKEMLLRQLSKLDAISSSLCIDQEGMLLTEMSGDDMYVVTEHSLVRGSSDETSNVLAMCFENDIIKVLPKQRSNVEDYHKILLDNGQTGFIPLSNVMPNYEICTVVCPTVIMDHIGGNILSELFEGDEVKVVLPRESQQIAIGQSWVKVRYENIFGWCLDLDLKEKTEGSSQPVQITNWLTGYTTPSKAGGRDAYAANLPSIFKDWYAYEKMAGIGKWTLLEYPNLIAKQGPDKELIDENGYYWIAAGPRIINEKYDDDGNLTVSKTHDDENILVMGKYADVVLEHTVTRDIVYLYCRIGDIKAHTWISKGDSQNGLSQTGYPYPNNASGEAPAPSSADGSSVEFMGHPTYKSNGDPDNGDMSKYRLLKIIVHD